jgi:cell division protein FtsQ
LRVRRRGRDDGGLGAGVAARPGGDQPAEQRKRDAAQGSAVAGLTVDPRMRSRRIAVRRDAGRRRLRRISLAVALLGALGLAVAAIRSPLLDVDRVAVAGTERTTVEEVLAAAGVDRGRPLIDVAPDAVAARVEELPWVASAEVGRSWPSTVDIEVTERVAVAVAPVADDRFALVDGDGWVVAVEPGAPPEPDPGGPLLVTDVDGRVAAGERLNAEARDALALAQAAAERMPGVLASVSTTLEAPLVQGGTVRFGSAEDLTDKITAVETVLSQVDTACLDVLDVTVAARPALTRHQRCS